MTKEIKVGNLVLGGGSRVLIQSMTNARTSDYEAVANQITSLEKAGCDIIRLAVSDTNECRMLKNFRQITKMPIVADIQFDYKLAISAIENGADKIRFNPGNIGSDEKVRMLADCAKAHKTPIRIGVNSGSVEKEFMSLQKADALVKSCMRHVKILESQGFYDIVLSVKSSSVPTMIAAYRELSACTDYPLHLGVTEAGDYEDSLVKSAIGIGALLAFGIGDTIRVSVTGDPVPEVYAAKKILRALMFDKNFCDIVSCPMCSRCGVDLEDIVKKVKAHTKNITKPLKIAVMGCAVNGPGEARDADFGVAMGGERKAVVFCKGEIIHTINGENIAEQFVMLLDKFLTEEGF